MQQRLHKKRVDDEAAALVEADGVEGELGPAVARPRREQKPVEVVEARARAARLQRERRRLDGALPVVREDLGRRALVAAANLGKKRVRNS